MGRYVYLFGGGKADGDGTQKDLLGGKGAGLAEMTRLGIPVPPGFTITTEVAVDYASRGPEHGLRDEIRAEVKAALTAVESLMKRKLGGADKPLLVSVRSGARASMPGMLDTILNLGINDDVARTLAKETGNERFAFDAYRRFIMMYSDIVLHVPRAKFEEHLDAIRYEVATKKGLSASQWNKEELKRRLPDSEIPASELEKLIGIYKDIVTRETGKPFPTDPEMQLWGAVRAVFESWNNTRAKTYRKMHGIPESWGTACNVQAMVFGNLGDDSATGVAFSRNPSTGENRFFGEWLPNAQGEDVVAGIRTPLPLSRGAESAHDTDSGSSLEVKMPEVFKKLVEVRDRLEKHFRDMQDLEFTIQKGQLFLLQCRNGKRTAQAAVRMAVEMVKEGLILPKEAILRVEASSIDQLLHPALDPKAGKTLLARGLPASPGAVSGEVVFSAEDAERRSAQGIGVILVRVETSPEDVAGMKAARGVLTARGGMTSHAAVVARGMGKCCVAGCSAISVDYAEQVMLITVYEDDGTKKDTRRIKAGDVITLDGSSGSVYLGSVPTAPAALSPEFAELMVWADAARTLRVRANADTPLDARTARNFGAEGIGLCRTEHMFFDGARIPVMWEMILATTRAAREKALDKLLPFQRGDFVGIFREMKGLPVTIRLLDPPLHEFLPQESAQLEKLARDTNTPLDELKKRSVELHEFNPMLGHRGCRLAVTYPEIYEMQVRAILEAACEVAGEGLEVLPEIMIPLVITRPELDRMRELVDRVAKTVFTKTGRTVPYFFGTMIELPRAALLAGDLTTNADFFSFGTNDLTQATMGLSRDDAGKFLPVYVEQGLLPADPFQSLDVTGVGALVRHACEKARAVKSTMKLGVCGEHGGDPASIRFFHEQKLAYVSCSPFRVPIARLAAAQAALSTVAGDTTA
ncbi:MAG TPA: pyruvate, phosphate dikinase [Polyangiaceae bacterium]|jgi:pyruvate,orthophosphate dikinase|nr:pyruvate, phosphate dikinase [Polyangiaceae bacterium]